MENLVLYRKELLKGNTETILLSVAVLMSPALFDQPISQIAKATLEKLQIRRKS
ncbi:MAG: hypothetical protein DK302_001726 [Chloroflexi bacterium]|jgi:hypothetical protein|nr:MAG: hypothetical protein DK302_001726 [Chloroflexota bacterium]